jgi:hypothetical protein
MKNKMSDISEFELALANLAANMGISSSELLLLAKECREQDSVKTNVDGFDDILKSLLEKDEENV